MFITKSSYQTLVSCVGLLWKLPKFLPQRKEVSSLSVRQGNRKDFKTMGFPCETWGGSSLIGKHTGVFNYSTPFSATAKGFWGAYQVCQPVFMLVYQLPLGSLQADRTGRHTDGSLYPQISDLWFQLSIYPPHTLNGLCYTREVFLFKSPC